MTLIHQLEKLPGSRQLHRWADWAELICMVNGRLSVPLLASSIEVREAERHTELDDDSEPSDSEIDELHEEYPSPAEFRDAVSRRSEDVFAYIAARAHHYGDAYPFEVTDRRQMRLRDARIDRSLYLFVLVCASFRYVAGAAEQTRLASRFEWLCLEAMRATLPDHAIVRLFGSNSVLNGHYSGLLFNKIGQLAEDLGERRIAQAREFAVGDSGDNGLDLVSWIPLVDQISPFPLFFGQCACTTEWVLKQHSSSKAAWNKTMTFSVPPMNFCFMPYDFREPGGDWFMPRLIHESVLMDRRRLLACLGALRGDDLNANFPELLEILHLDELLLTAGYELV